MPKATVTTTGTQRFDLKTLPPTDGEEGGYVVLRRMTYGQKLERLDLATKSTMKATTERRSRNQEVEAEMDIKLMNRLVAEFEFAHCVVEHNLQHDNGQPLNFRDPNVLDLLDPRVGDEIASYIGEMNNFEEIVNEPGNL